MVGLRAVVLAVLVAAAEASNCKPAAASFLQVEEGASDPCAFCRGLSSKEEDVCAGKADEEACRLKLKTLLAGCKKVLEDPCCKTQPKTFRDRAKSCANQVCPMVVPSCPAGSSVKDKGWWQGCCFDAETDCTSDMCQVAHGGCAHQAMCKSDEAGKATCKCNLGYSGDGMTCDAINNCLIENGNCDQHAQCHNLGPGKNRCTCDPGYTGAGTLSSPCSLYNVCTDRDDACDSNAKCHYRGGGLYDCTCNPGYTGAGTPGNCSAEDLCVTNHGGCHSNAVCTMLAVGQAKCECMPGYSGDGKYCELVDQCLLAKCDAHAKCISGGPGDSRCECNQGYSGDGASCKPRDNCKYEEENDCSKNGICIMTGPKTHRCECKPGFSGDGRDCQFVNSCKHNFGGCDSTWGINASSIWDELPKVAGMSPPDGFAGEDLVGQTVSKCISTGAGTNNCSCVKGYEVDTSVKSFKCKVVNNCAKPNRGGCHKNAACIDLGLGRNLCQCYKGFRGDGKNNCSEINPCLEGSSGCHENADCTYLGAYKNREGRYEQPEKYGAPEMPTFRAHFKHIGEVHQCKCRADNYTGNGTHCTKVCYLNDNDCEHGGRLHPAFNFGSCKCTGCQAPWEGIKCNECPVTDLDCAHDGVVNKETCQCEQCKDGFAGDRCQICNRTQAQCGHGGKLNRATCKCERCGKYVSAPGPFGEKKKPIERWTGDFCKTCRWSGDDCVHASAIVTETTEQKTKKEKDTVRIYTPTRLNNFNESACKCERCMKPWGGALCEICSLKPVDCRHKSRLNPRSCKCEDCMAPWTGELCNTCQHTEACKAGDEANCPCKHGSVLNEQKCRCEKPVGPWTGKHFDKCARTQDDCNNGVLDVEACKCTGCGPFWTGELCEVCTLSQKLCKNGGEFDPERCLCRNCRYPWGGSTCEACIREPTDCLHGSVVNEQCVCAESKKSTNCPAPWSGATCGACPMIQKNCKNGGILNKDECVCEGCAPFGGKFCDVCEITAAMCKHGSVPDTASCSCKHPKGTEDRQCGPSGRWGGTYCDTCMVADSDCKHMSRLNPTLCQCEDKLKGPTGEGEMRCPVPWGGMSCDKCLPDRIFGEGEPIECGHGGSFSMVECKCTNCAEGWGGPDCNDCVRDEGKCLHGSKLHDDTCKCTAPGGGNVGNWVGDYQETCGLSCKNGGTLNALLCICNCGQYQNSDTQYWKGNDCSEAP